MKVIEACDLFCGAGGSSNGLYDACAQLGMKPRLRAINHWPVAVETHKLNHPDAEHLCETLDSVDPRKLVDDRRLHILIASPECTHHSNARGGVPMSDQSRASAWHVLRWAEALDIERILVENVREFTQWGPLYGGRPIKSRRGETFKAWCNALESLGYQLEWRIVNCADYGDPTTRKRFFLMARKGRRRPNWPGPTHADPSEQETLFDTLEPWTAAREIIDWNLKGESVFGRKRPLAPNTMRRIMAGLKKFCGDAFIVPQFSSQDPRSVDRPLGTVTTTSRGVGLAQPFLVVLNGTKKEQIERTAKSVDRPLPAVVGSGHIGLAQPFVLGQQSGGAPRSTDKPLPTIAAKGAIALVEPYLIAVNHDTITAKDRFGLVQPEIKAKDAQYAVVDIRFRMLQPHELAAAMSFPKDYKFTGNRAEKVRQIGNAVPRRTAAKLCHALLAS